MKLKQFTQAMYEPGTEAENRKVEVCSLVQDGLPNKRFICTMKELDDLCKVNGNIETNGGIYHNIGEFYVVSFNPQMLPEEDHLPEYNKSITVVII